MDPARFTRVDRTTWRVEPSGTMRVPVIIYADENLIQDMGMGSRLAAWRHSIRIEVA